VVQSLVFTGRPIDQAQVRRSNLGLALQTIALDGPLPRAALAARIGLNKATVSSIVAELIALGLVATEEGGRSGTVGRPAQLLRVSGARYAAIGLELDFDQIILDAPDLSGTTRLTSRCTFDARTAGPEGTAEAIARIARNALETLAGEGLSVVDVSVTVDAVVDHVSGMILSAPDLGWQSVPFRELLSRALAPLRGPLHIDNDANVAALAEQSFGAARGLRDFVYVWGSSGIGAGIVCGGQLYRGSHGFGGEIGHTTIDRDGPLCECGRRGCLGMLAAADVLLEKAGIPNDASLAERTAQLAVRARADDRQSLEAMADVGAALGAGVASFANVLDPEAFVLGGAYATLAEWLVPPIQAELDRRAPGAEGTQCRVLVSTLGDAGPSTGAAELRLRDVLANPASYAPAPAEPAAPATRTWSAG
jgi:predicted NBD/HSP70 family sugar kinase